MRQFNGTFYNASALPPDVRSGRTGGGGGAGALRLPPRPLPGPALDDGGWGVNGLAVSVYNSSKVTSGPPLEVPCVRVCACRRSAPAPAASRC